MQEFLFYLRVFNLDPGDTIFKLIKEHKNQTVEIRHKTSDDVERYNQYPFYFAIVFFKQKKNF